MKRVAFIFMALATPPLFASEMCAVGEVLTEDGCKRVVQQTQASVNDPRRNDRRCYDDGFFDPYDDDCMRAYPELVPEKGYQPHLDDDRWDD